MLLMKSVRLILRFALVLAILISSTTAFAGNYHVEIIVFQNNGAAHSGNYNADGPAPAPSYGKTWPMKRSYLGGYAKKLRNSPSYTILQHTAWGQKSAPYSSSAAGRLSANGLQGWVKIYAPSLLFTQLDISANGQRLQERRRLKLNEVHFFDHEGFGVLLRVSRS